MVGILTPLGLSANGIANLNAIAAKQQQRWDNLTTHIESFYANRWELEPLFDEHYKEISAHRKHDIKLAPDWEKYARLEKCGELVFIALRRQGKLVGYYTGFISTAIHYKDTLQLGLDLFYVHPQSRGKINGQNGGVLLRDAMVCEAKRRGVRVITAGAKTFKLKHMEKLFKDGGFEPFEIHYALWL